MDNNKRMNILILGNSGAGKSTLIEAIAGKKVPTGIGEGNTQKISVYESDVWPFRLIDTKGFEYNFFEQLKTIKQVRDETKSQINSEDGMDAVWYCLEGTTRRMFSDNVKMMNRAIKGWKEIPVFAVITKSYSEMDEIENIEAVKELFLKMKDVNLKNIIPVVAKDYKINEDVTVFAKGLSELCTETINIYDEAKQISTENKNNMILKQKRFTAEAAISGATTAAVAIGAIPFNFADSLILIPIETTLTKGIFKIYGVNFSEKLVTEIVGSAAITAIAKATLNSLRVVPIAGQILNAVVAGFFVFALGQSVVVLTEEIYKGNIDPDDISKAVEIVAEKMKNNPVLGTAVKYLEDNYDKFRGKTAKEIFNTVMNVAVKSLKKK